MKNNKKKNEINIWKLCFGYIHMGLCHILHCDKDCVLIQASAKIFENHHLKVQLSRTYYITHRTLLGVMWQPGWERSLGRMDTCICMAKFLCYSPVTVTTLLISHVKVCLLPQSCLTLCNPPIQNKKVLK